MPLIIDLSNLSEQLMNLPDLGAWGLWGLFIGTFLAATVVPFSADVLYISPSNRVHTRKRRVLPSRKRREVSQGLVL